MICDPSRKETSGRMVDSDIDTLIRLAAFDRVKALSATHDHLTSNDLKAGFTFQGQRIPFINQQQGIFKPKQMTYLLSIRTVYPRPGGRVWYDDQRHVHDQIYKGHDVIDYAFMGDNPEAFQNRWLREAMEKQIPVIYFLGIAPGIYEPIFPTYVVSWDPAALKAGIAFGLELKETESGVIVAADPIQERRYALREVKQRLHQATFREAVIQAYGGRCALSGLPEPLLIDAAHIISDKDEKFGQPVVQNGIPLSKIHHAAFDAQLIGIDPDYKIHVADRLLVQRDGPMLEALKQLSGQSIHLPGRERDYPDRDRLAQRYEIFKRAA
jgi:putative restriction endonuclease